MAMGLLHLETAPFNLYSLTGMILVSGLLWAPGVFILMAVPFRSMDPSLEEAAAASGANS
jgi:iron(III) transport system permease protein